MVDLSTEGAAARSRLVSADLQEMQNLPVGKFQESLKAELKKVNQFACVKHEDIFLGLRRLCTQCKKISLEEVQLMAMRIRSLGEEIVYLDAPLGSIVAYIAKSSLRAIRNGGSEGRHSCVRVRRQMSYMMPKTAKTGQLHGDLVTCRTI